MKQYNSGELAKMLGIARHRVLGIFRSGLIPEAYKDPGLPGHPWQVPESAIPRLREAVEPFPGNEVEAFYAVTRRICKICGQRDYDCGVCRLHEVKIALDIVLKGKMGLGEAIVCAEELYGNVIKDIQDKYDREHPVERRYRR